MSTISAGTTSTTTLIHSGDTTGSLVLKTNDTGSGGTTALTLDTSQNATFAGTASATKLIPTGSSATGNGMYLPTTNAVAFSTAGTEAMRIDSSGGLRVGVTTNIYGSASAEKFSVKNTSAGVAATFQSTDVTGGYPVIYISSLDTANAGQTAIYFYRSASIVGSVSTTASATAYNTSSDYRLKENIAPMTGALNTVARLKPVTYKWKLDGSDGQGFIAHELQEVVPDCVTGTKDAVGSDGNPVYQGVDTSFLVATLTAAIQEQQTLITTLTARIEALENK